MSSFSLNEFSTVLIAIVIIFGSGYLNHASQDAWLATKRRFKKKRPRKRR